MARQNGALKLTGTVAGLTFRQTADGEIASQKSSLTKERVRTDPAFERSRVAGQAFKKAGQYAGLLNRTFRKVLKDHSDARVVGRLSGAFMKILMQDTGSYAEVRQLIPGLLPQLKGFECNKGTSFSGVLPVQLSYEGDREAREWVVTVPDMNTKAIKWPPGAAFFRVTVGLAAMDFEALTGRAQVMETEWMPQEAHEEVSKTMNFTLEDGAELPVIGIASVNFAGESNGDFYPLFNKSFNPATIVVVDVV